MEKYCENIPARWTGRHEASLALVGDIRGKMILDIGCSFGWFEAGAVKRGCRSVVGIDRDGRQLSRARAAVPEASFARVKLPPLPFPNYSFDLVALWEVLEHLPRRDAVPTLREIGRVLRPGGFLFLSTPKFDLRSTLTDPAWYLGHRHYTRKHLGRLLAEGGFRIIRLQSAGGIFEIITMLLFYPFRWLTGREVPAKRFLERRRRREYGLTGGWCTYFVKASRINNSKR